MRRRLRHAERRRHWLVHRHIDVRTADRRRHRLVALHTTLWCLSACLSLPSARRPASAPVLAQTASQAAIGQPWSARVRLRYSRRCSGGAPAARQGGRRDVRNRATPLFRLYSADANDFAETTSPQYALSLMIAQAHDYVEPGSGLGAEPIVPDYAFPYDATIRTIQRHYATARRAARRDLRADHRRSRRATSGRRCFRCI